MVELKLIEVAIRCKKIPQNLAKKGWIHE